MLVTSFVDVTKILEKNNLREEGFILFVFTSFYLFWLRISESSGLGFLVPCTWAEHHGGRSVWWRRFFMLLCTRSREKGHRKRPRNPSILPLATSQYCHCAMTLSRVLIHSLGESPHLLVVSGNPIKTPTGVCFTNLRGVFIYLFIWGEH
jgi:hypothetical protein